MKLTGVLDLVSVYPVVCRNARSIVSFFVTVWVPPGRFRSLIRFRSWLADSATCFHGEMSMQVEVAEEFGQTVCSFIRFFALLLKAAIFMTIACLDSFPILQ